MHSQNAFIQAASLAKLFRHTDNFFGVLMMLHTILWLMQNMHSDNLYLTAASAVVPMVPLLVLFQPALWPKWQMPREGDWGWNGCSSGWNNLGLRKSHTFSSFCPATIHSEFQAQKSPTLLVAPAEDAHCWKEQISSNNMAEFLNIPTTSNISEDSQDSWHAFSSSVSASCNLFAHTWSTSAKISKNHDLLECRKSV